MDRNTAETPAEAATRLLDAAAAGALKAGLSPADWSAFLLAYAVRTMTGQAAMALKPGTDRAADLAMLGDFARDMQRQTLAALEGLRPSDPTKRRPS